MVLLIILAAAAGPATIYLYLNVVPHVTNSIIMSGTLIINSDGQARGTSGLSTAYNASLSVSHGVGSMNLTLPASNRDLLLKHDYAVTNLVANDTLVSMQIDGKYVMMVFVPTDSTDTGQFKGFFLAAWGPSTSNKGIISPLFFDGAGSQSFVELRLTPVAPPLPTFMSMGMTQEGGFVAIRIGTQATG